MSRGRATHLPDPAQGLSGRSWSLDLDQDLAREGELAHSPATCVAKAEGASVRTLRQIIFGDEVIQLVIRLGLLAVLIVWTLLLIRPFVPILAWSVVSPSRLIRCFSALPKSSATGRNLRQRS